LDQAAPTRPERHHADRYGRGHESDASESRRVGQGSVPSSLNDGAVTLRPTVGAAASPVTQGRLPEWPGRFAARLVGCPVGDHTASAPQRLLGPRAGRDAGRIQPGRKLRVQVGPRRAVGGRPGPGGPTAPAGCGGRSAARRQRPDNRNDRVRADSESVRDPPVGLRPVAEFKLASSYWGRRPGPDSESEPETCSRSDRDSESRPGPTHWQVTVTPASAGGPARARGRLGAVTSLRLSSCQ
jgi:hypothetical protein